MKKIIGIISIILVVALMACVFVACDDNSNNSNNSGNDSVDTTSHVDYVSQLKLNLNSSTPKLTATVKNYIDGDTTHFNVDSSVIPGGVLKARYLAINTPESTGKIEQYGKAASKFTQSKLESAVSIIVEPDGNQWEADSTGSRYLTWVWYKTSADGEYRNLNVEILQAGLAIASNTANNRYGDIASAALQQAKTEKLNIFSGKNDPDFYIGDAIELTLDELRCNIEDYEGKKVAFEGIVTLFSSNGVYVESESPCADTGLYNGIYCYLGYNANQYVLDIMTPGNKVRVVGTVSYYPTGGTYQVSGMDYRAMKPTDPNNCQKLDDQVYAPAYKEIDVTKLANGTVEYEYKDEEGNDATKNVKYGDFIMDTTVSLENLVVSSIYTTDNDESNNNGAMTLTCYVGGTKVTVRTSVLKDADDNIITDSAYLGKTISIKGIVAYYNGNYQIKVLTANDITVLD